MVKFEIIIEEDIDNLEQENLLADLEEVVGKKGYSIQNSESEEI